jgi:hypothetical protein
MKTRKSDQTGDSGDFRPSAEFANLHFLRGMTPSRKSNSKYLIMGWLNDLARARRKPKSILVADFSSAWKIYPPAKKCLGMRFGAGKMPFAER